jgi:hypothetical protein
MAAKPKRRHSAFANRTIAPDLRLQPAWFSAFPADPCMKPGRKTDANVTA